MSQFKVGDRVESEFFTDVQYIRNIKGNSVYVSPPHKADGQWYLMKQVEQVGKLKTEKPISVGIKHDQDKPDLSLLPKEALEAMARAFMHGEKKYGRYNFRAGMDWHRPLAAALRHLTAFNEGENIDPESNGSHLGHALAAIAMITVYQVQNVGTDTRYKKA